MCVCVLALIDRVVYRRITMASKQQITYGCCTRNRQACSHCSNLHAYKRSHRLFLLLVSSLCSALLCCFCLFSPPLSSTVSAPLGTGFLKHDPTHTHTNDTDTSHFLLVSSLSHCAASEASQVFVMSIDALLLLTPLCNFRWIHPEPASMCIICVSSIIIQWDSPAVTSFLGMR